VCHRKKKNMDKKTKKNAEGPRETLGKDWHCRGQAGGPSAKSDLRQRFAEGPEPPLLWAYTAECPVFVEGPALGKDRP